MTISIYRSNTEIEANLNIILNLLENKTAKVYDKHQNNDIDDIDGFGMQIFCRIIKSLRTLLSICTSSKDYPVANNVLRMIADSVSVYKLIYTSKDHDEKLFRHYLYILDGLSTRNSLMQCDLDNNDKMNQDDFIRLKKKYESTRQSDEGAIKYCKEKLNNHIYSKTYPEFHIQSVENYNWRYKDTVYKKNVNKNRYSWEELYKLLNIPNNIPSFISSYLSQFAHGFCMSNILLDESDEIFTPILSFAFVFAGILKNEFEHQYSKYITI